MNNDIPPVRIVTILTVSLLIVAGSPIFDTTKVDAESNPYISPAIMDLKNSPPTSSGSIISWITNISSNNRVYYGLKETDVNSFINGSWSIWSNNTLGVMIRLSGLNANSTYYYKAQSWNFISNDSSTRTFRTLKPGVWTDPSEYMIKSPGFGTNKPVNISAVILDNKGRYISNISLEAVVYNDTGTEIIKINLEKGDSNGTYSGIFIPDNLNEGVYTIRITNYSEIAGEFSILRWSCIGCHSAGGSNNPSTFNPSIVHVKHLDTIQINVIHCGDEMCESQVLYTSTNQCGNCHILRYPSWIQHPKTGNCNDCHNNQRVKCENCHNDLTTKENYLSPRYGQDIHYQKLSCSDCHGGLDVVNNKPNCTACHPRPGSIISNIPDSIENGSHSKNKTVKCGLCHNREHDIKSLTNLDITVCRSCHPSITHNRESQCTTCHGNDPHQVSNASHSYFKTEQECRSCHEGTVDRHHSLRQYQCLDCHKIKYDPKNKTYYPEIIRDCLKCHKFS